jgi:hypothetical protein
MRRLLLSGDHCQTWLPGAVQDLLVARAEIQRAIVAADWDEYKTEHRVLRGGGAGTTVHGVEVTDLQAWPDEAIADDSSPLACGLARVPVVRAELHPSDGPDARAAAAALFDVPVQRLHDADRRLEWDRELMLCQVAGTYGMWWEALGVPWPGASIDGDRMVLRRSGRPFD